jgi:hypothetical protein
MHEKRNSLCARPNPNRIDYSNATIDDLERINGKNVLKGPGHIPMSKLRELRMQNINNQADKGNMSLPFKATNMRVTKNAHVIPKEMLAKDQKKTKKDIKKATKELKSVGNKEKKHIDVNSLLKKIKRE